ncbi:unnamed protein product [Owenia fusiformis]|uniref:Nuclease EXOG, mitochondrial n=1 Tax=Owenia fusiformis TaxID=6347 RepID=A0A8J1XKP6_OWEFU|nr:unnamed protein product [Owenia fusiformis]
MAQPVVSVFLRGFLSGGLVSSALFGIYSYNNNANLAIESGIHVEYQESLTDPSYKLRGDQILKYGVPDRGPDVRYYRNHALTYDQSRKSPIWVAEHLNKEVLTGSANRKHSKFKPDVNIPEMYNAANSDFYKSGWSRGHMAPAGDNKFDQVAMDESFYLSNIVPQDLNNNGQFWNKLEMYTRDLVQTKGYSDVWVVTGPIVRSTIEENGKKFVKYEVIGKNEVPVPTHLYKIILAETGDKQTKLIGAFVVPNQPIQHDHTLRQYQVTLEDLQIWTGINFFPKLDKSTTKNLCDVDQCKLLSREQFELYFIGRKLDSARNISRLEKVWSELDEKNLKPDQFLIELYNRKKSEIDLKEKEE